MDPWITAILSVSLIILAFLCFRKAYAVHKIKQMSMTEKLERIDRITIPFGFKYMLTQDIFTSCLNAWQKDYGYCRLYDEQASHFHMVFDCEPIYFNYDGRTWLVEFWKGQYGICSGGEIGIYRADRLVPEEEWSSTFFQSIPPEQMPVFSFSLLHKCLPFCRLCRRHWWLTGFCIGQYSEPESLCMKITITFPDAEMCQAFTNALIEAGYEWRNIYTTDNAVAFTYDTPYFSQPRHEHPLYSAWVQYKNRLLLFLFRRCTSPFCFSIDRLLLLYEYLPFLLRRILLLHSIKRKRGK